MALAARCLYGRRGKPCGQLEETACGFWRNAPSGPPVSFIGRRSRINALGGHLLIAAVARR